MLKLVVEKKQRPTIDRNQTTSTMQTEEIERVLDAYPHITEHIQGLQEYMVPGSVTVFGPPWPTLHRPHIKSHIPLIPMPPGSVNDLGPPCLPVSCALHANILHASHDMYARIVQREFVQRAIYRAGITTRVLFTTGDVVVVCMTREPERHRGLSAVAYVTPEFEATLRTPTADSCDLTAYPLLRFDQ